jgi:hypothetical protein
MEKSILYYGDNLNVLRENIKDESVDLILISSISIRRSTARPTTTSCFARRPASNRTRRSRRSRTPGTGEIPPSTHSMR